MKFFINLGLYSYIQDAMASENTVFARVKDYIHPRCPLLS